MRNFFIIFILLSMIFCVYADTQSIVGDYKVISGSVFTYVTFYSNGAFATYSQNHEEKGIYTWYIEDDVLLYVNDLAYIFYWEDDILILVPQFGEIEETVYLQKL